MLALAASVPARAGAQVEEPDPTRLDAARLPPEAIELRREHVAHGFFVEAWVGARGFVGGAGPLVEPGPFLSAGAGVEITRFLWVHAAFEASLHETGAPPPPTRSAFEILGGVLGLRLQVEASARVALWLAAEAGLATALGGLLEVYGVEDAGRAGWLYGGTLGMDVHLVNRHVSLGLLGGARVHPAFADPADDAPAVAVHGAAYLRFVP